MAAPAVAGVVVATSTTHPLRVDWLINNDDGEDTRAARLGMTFAPGKHQDNPSLGFHMIWRRDLEMDMATLKTRWKCDVLVSLMEEHEYKELGIMNLQDSAMRVGIELIKYPIPDGGVPASLSSCNALVDQIVSQHLVKGHCVVIHCKGGLGRTGTIVALVLMQWKQRTAIEAITEVRRARPGTIENVTQEKFVQQWRLPPQPFATTTTTITTKNSRTCMIM
jgi:ADP-ribosyl-[dinitrogen reductase] hydrolase